MASIKLYFASDDGAPELSKTVFSSRGAAITAYRGRVTLSGEASSSFTWSAAVRTLSYLLCRSKLAFLLGEQLPYVLEGESKSLASSLDLAIAKRTQWICDLFGVEESNILVLRRLLNIDNPERKRPGPVRLCLNLTQLHPRDVSIYRDDLEVTSPAELEDLCLSLLKKASEDTRTPRISLPLPSPSKSRASADAYWFMADVFQQPVVDCDYWSEWFPLLQGIIHQVRHSLYGTVSGAEMHRWWFSRIGTAYMVQNCSLLASGGDIRRIILLNGPDDPHRAGALLHGYVQRALGVNVRVCENWEELRAKIPGNPYYLSIFDETFSMQMHESAGHKFARLSSVNPQVDQEIYNSMFFDTALCSPLEILLDSGGFSFEERAQAESQIQLIKNIFSTKNGCLSSGPKNTPLDQNPISKI